jgi:hypothetical protein
MSCGLQNYNSPGTGSGDMLLQVYGVDHPRRVYGQDIYSYSEPESLGPTDSSGSTRGGEWLSVLSEFDTGTIRE